MKNDSLWSQLTAFSNLYASFQSAARSRRSRPSVASFEFNLEENLIILQKELTEHRWSPGAYTNFYIHDPKHRLISAAPFRDRVVHHALYNIIEPIFERKFIFDSYANRIGKGTHRALDRCTGFLRRYRYVLPIDIVQYFPSIDHQTLLDLLKGEIADLEVVNLCQQIIASGCGIHPAVENIEFPPSKKGLPIGNLTSQFWANVYLNPLDHYIKRTLKCKAYLRYVDDMLLFSDSKEELWRWLTEIQTKLWQYSLRIHSSSAQPRPCACGIPFLGFQVFPDHRRLKHQKITAARRRFKNMMTEYQQHRINSTKVKERILAWVNHARYGDTWNLRQEILENIIL